MYNETLGQHIVSPTGINHNKNNIVMILCKPLEVVIYSPNIKLLLNSRSFPVIVVLVIEFVLKAGLSLIFRIFFFIFFLCICRTMIC